MKKRVFSPGKKRPVLNYQYHISLECLFSYYKVCLLFSAVDRLVYRSIGFAKKNFKIMLQIVEIKCCQMS